MKKTKIVIFTFFMVTCLCVFLNAQWQTSGSNIYFNTGNTGIGLDDPQRTLDMTGRLRIRTDPVIEFFQDGAIQSYLQYHNASNTLRLYHAQAGGDQLVLNSDGFVGIGIEEPQRSLDMAGRLLIRHDPVIELYQNGAIQSYLQYHNPSNTLRLYHAQAGGDQLVLNSDGFVGIGIEEPQRSLDMAGRLLIRHDPVIELYHNGAIQSYLQHHNTTNTLRIYHAQAGGDQLVIHPNSNVGIGCTNPTETLTVNGTIKAEKVIVEQVICANDIQTNLIAADFVFRPDYNLKPLNEVETYIRANGHLPDVPSAESIRKDGIGLAEMNTLLLQKVEELTLYMLDLQKQNHNLQNRLQKLENIVK